MKDALRRRWRRLWPPTRRADDRQRLLGSLGRLGVAASYTKEPWLPRAGRAVAWWWETHRTLRRYRSHKRLSGILKRSRLVDYAPDVPYEPPYEEGYRTYGD